MEMLLMRCLERLLRRLEELCGDCAINAPFGAVMPRLTDLCVVSAWYAAFDGVTILIHSKFS